MQATTNEAVRNHAGFGRLENVDPVLTQVAGEQQFYNTSELDLPRLLDDPANIADNLRAYLAGFSAVARETLDKFDFDRQVTRRESANLRYLVVSKFCDIDLHPDVVPNEEMGYLYEELVRRFPELSNETAGEQTRPITDAEELDRHKLQIWG